MIFGADLVEGSFSYERDFHGYNESAVLMVKIVAKADNSSIIYSFSGISKQSLGLSDKDFSESYGILGKGG